jgi:ethanolamine utilization protein EutJ
LREISAPKITSLGLESTLTRAEQVVRWISDPELPPFENVPEGQLYVGVDLGTAYLMLVVLDQEKQPIAGEYQFAHVVRDGLVVDFIGAVDLLKGMKDRVEQRLGVQLSHAASGYPPGVPRAEVQAVANVVEAAGMGCTHLVDEPTAANALLRLKSGAIVDVGGGTTGIAILKDGEVVYTADEATGGTHFSLVVAGSLDIPFEEAEKLKVNPNQQVRLFPILRPVMEKVASIVNRHISTSGVVVEQLTLVGGTCTYRGMAEVIQDYTGLPTRVPDRPVFVTPLGIAMHDQEMEH